jgi:hypothetical protein
VPSPIIFINRVVAREYILLSEMFRRLNRVGFTLKLDHVHSRIVKVHGPKDCYCTFHIRFDHDLIRGASLHFEQL